MSSTPQQIAPSDDNPQIMEVAGKRYWAKRYDYVFPTFTFAANGTIPQSITIDSDANFLMIELVQDFPAADGPNISVTVAEGGAGGMSWSNLPVNIDNWAGTAQLPFAWGLIPQILPSKRVYTLTVTNATGGAVSGQVVFRGYKLYPIANAGGAGASAQS